MLDDKAPVNNGTPSHAFLVKVRLQLLSKGPFDVIRSPHVKCKPHNGRYARKKTYPSKHIIMCGV